MKWLLIGVCCLMLLCGAALAEENIWQAGFGAADIVPDAQSGEPLYIAGYNSAWEITGVLDVCQAKAVWLETGGRGVLLIGIDCIALDSGTVEQIKRSLSDIPDCQAIHVYATHTHAGPDTLGLWGPTGVDGKNDAYMLSLLRAAEKAARDARADRKAGRLSYAYIDTQDMYRDSRDPQVYDARLHQVRFAPLNGGGGIRLYFYGAHAESLRGDNTLLSRDFPGLLCDNVQAATGDRVLYMPGAVGGLIMTRAFVQDTGRQALENMQITADRLTEYALGITADHERQLATVLRTATESVTVPLDNPVFLLYRFLGILTNKVAKADSATGYGVETQVSALQLGDMLIALLPGEIFPELVTGEAYACHNAALANPEPLAGIARKYGFSDLLLIGLCDDEIGYIVPPSDFLVNEKMPYIERIRDASGEDHYEETNATGPEAAAAIAQAFERALQKLTQ